MNPAIIARISDQYPEVPIATIEDLLLALKSPYSVCLLLLRDTTDLDPEVGGTVLEPPNPVLPPPTEIRLFGAVFRVHLPEPRLHRLLHDSECYLERINRPRAVAWLTSQDHTGKTYLEILEGFVSAGSRSGRIESYVNDSVTVLSTLFARVSQGTTMSRFKRAHWDLFLAIEDLHFHPPKKLRSVARPHLDVVEVKNPYASHLTQKALSLDRPEQQAHDEKLAWRFAGEEAQESGCTFECQCCFSEVPFEALANCPIGHIFCVECLKKSVGTLIGEGRSFVKCLSIEEYNCDVSLLELERVLPPETLETLTQTETLNAVMKTPITNLVTCHRCGIPTIFEKCKGNHIFRCPNCSAETCLKCRMIAHPGITCKDFKLKDPTVLIQEKMNEALVRTCPTCQAQIMKELGCNRMECPRCHTWFCYYCRQVIPKTVGYAHFWRERERNPRAHARCL
jgi:TRIAD3 protein (E3 ubiquitin-protein ligase RNF216)